MKSADRSAFLFMGVLCWMCAAIVIAGLTLVLFGWIPATFALIAVTGLVLLLVWSLGGAAEGAGRS